MEAGGQARGEASRRRGTCLAADGNKAPGASAGELAGATWRRVAGRASPTRPRPGDAAAPPLSTVPPSCRPCPLHLVLVPSSSSHGQTEGPKTEVWKSENNGDAVVLAAEKAAITVVDAAISTSVSRLWKKHMFSLSLHYIVVPSVSFIWCYRSSDQVNEEHVVEEAVKISEDQDLEDFVTPNHEQLLQLREKYSIPYLQVLGEYIEALGPVLHEKGVDVCLTLLQRGIKDQGGCGHFALLHEILRLICVLAAHRKFAALFVDRGGIQKILSVPRITQTYTALFACLFTFGSLQSTMEHVCALSSDTLNNVVELALQLLSAHKIQLEKMLPYSSLLLLCSKLFWTYLMHRMG